MTPTTQRMVRTLTSVTLIASIGFGTAACTPQETWHPVTTEESQLLAVSRFNNTDTGTRTFATSVTVQGADLEILGWYDFVEHIGYANVTGLGFEPQALLWDDQNVALRTHTPAADGLPQLDADPLAAPADDAPWTQRAIDPTASALDTLLASFHLLGNDRPDNPLLLQQSGALFLGTEAFSSTFDGPDSLLVFAAPPSDEPLSASDAPPTPESATVKFWLDDSALMHRTEIFLGNAWVSIDFDAASGPELTPLAPVLDPTAPPQSRADADD